MRATYAGMLALALAGLLLHLNAHHRWLADWPSAPSAVQALVRRWVVWCYACSSIAGAALAAHAGYFARSADVRRQALALCAGLGPYGVFRLVSLMVPGFVGSSGFAALEWVAPYLLPIGLLAAASSVDLAGQRSRLAHGAVSLLALGEFLVGGSLLVFTMTIALRTRLPLEWSLILTSLITAAVLWPVLRHLGGIIDAVFFPERLELRERELLALVDERTMRLTEALADAQRAREEAVAQRARAEDASRAKSLFLANMSHELRTPLAGVLGFANLMDRTPERSPEDRHHLDVIQRSGEHLLELINDVLSLSKIEAGRSTLQHAPFDLPAQLTLIEQMMRVRAADRRLWLRVELDPALPRIVVGDEGRLRQILLNLLANAVKFTEQGGVTLRAHWAQGRAGFEVSDTGPGIAPDEMPRVFEPFLQTEAGHRSNEGTGLGLSLSRQLARLMDGDITVTSEAGQGATFRLEVSLPLAPADALVVSRFERRRVVTLVEGQSAPLVLVVDDLPVNRELLTRLLDSVGFRVREATSGEEAVAAWRQWRPDFIWMDKRMPGIGGLEATRLIRDEEQRNARPRVPIVAISASALEHERGEILAAGCDDFVPKPFPEAAVFAKLQEFLGVRYAYEARPAPRSEPSRGAVSDDADGRRVLLVDDDTVCRLVSEEGLRALGLQVTPVASGEAALHAFEQASFDLVLMDLQMPGMGGVETARRIRTLPKRRAIPMIAMTADSFEGEPARFAETGMDDFIGKPIDPVALAELVRRWLPVEPVGLDAVSRSESCPAE